MTPPRPVRLLCIVPDLGVGGAERHVVTLLPNLDPSRFSAAALCLGEPGALFPDLAATGVPVEALRLVKRQAWRQLRGTVRAIRRFRPDIVIVRGYNAEVIGRIAAALCRVPAVVVWVHNDGDITPRGRIRVLVDRLLDRVTDAYYGVAYGQLEYLTGELGHPAEKITIIHNGVDPSPFEPDAPPDPELERELGISTADPVVGILAALRPEKDHATLLRAHRRIVDSLPAARLLVVGDGPERQRLEKLTAELGLTTNVIFTGSRSDVPEVLRLCDVVALTSTSIECFPMALLEAMASGLPAVATSVGGLPELVDDGVTGHLAAPRDADGIAEKLLAVLRDPEDARRMGRAARRRVEERFTLDQAIRVTEQALVDTVREATGRRGEAPVELTLVMDLTWVGGAERVLLETFRAIDRTRVRPRLVCLREAGPLAQEFRDAGVPVEVLERSGRYDLRTLPRLVRSLKESHADVVLVAHHHRAALALGRVAARISGARSVVAAHDMDLTSVGGRCLPRSTVETLWLSDALVLLARSQGDYLHREEGVGRFPWRRTREVVVPNGIPLPPAPTEADRAAVRSELGCSRDDVVIGIIARLSAQKAHEVLFRAVSRLPDALPRVSVLVVGDGPRAEELASLTADLGIDDRVRFLGIRRDVSRLLAGIDISCLSSVHEGVPLTVLESMAAGVPVVVTGCGALPEIVDDTVGRVVPVGDDRALAAALAELVSDETLRRALGAAGRRRAEDRYSVERTARDLENLLLSLTPGASS